MIDGGSVCVLARFLRGYRGEWPSRRSVYLSAGLSLLTATSRANPNGSGSIIFATDIVYRINIYAKWKGANSLKGEPGAQITNYPVGSNYQPFAMTLVWLKIHARTNEAMHAHINTYSWCSAAVGGCLVCSVLDLAKQQADVERTHTPRQQGTVTLLTGLGCLHRRTIARTHADSFLRR